MYLKGFVDSGEEANNALKREFLEETMNSEEATEEQKNEMEEKCTKLFQNGVEVRTKCFQFSVIDSFFNLRRICRTSNCVFP